MIVEEVLDKVEVISKFKNGAIQPLKLNWNNSIYQVKKILNKWNIKENGRTEHHFSLQLSDDSIVEIYLENKEMIWILRRIFLEG